jgi:hypothetical protein
MTIYVSLKKRLLALNLIFLLLPTAYGAQDASIKKNNTPIRQEPNDSSKVIDYLQEGDEVRVSSYPVNGVYYKVRARNGQYGWVNIKYTTIRVPDPNFVDPNAPPEPERERLYAVRLFGGAALFKPQDLNDVYNFSELNNGWTVGGEVAWRFSPRFSLLFRVQGMLKDVVAKEIVTQYVYNLNIRSYPTMVGIDFLMLRDFPVHISIGVLAGLALKTTFSSEALNLPTPNRVVLETTPFTTLLRIHATRPLGRMFSVFGEAGYQILKSELVNTSNSSSGGGVFKIAGEYKQRVIDLSGFTLSAGFGFHF